MPAEQTPITASARRTTFWPSIARASAELDARRSRGGRSDPGDPAVLRGAAPAITVSRGAQGAGR